MKFKIVNEDVAQDLKTVENNSVMLLEFHIYSPDRSNPQADQYVAQLEQRISAMKAENSEQKDEFGRPYSMYRLTGKPFKSIQEILQFFQNEFKDFISLLQNIWKLSNNFIRVVVVNNEVSPPKRMPGRDYPLLSISDFNNMIGLLSKN